MIHTIEDIAFAEELFDRFYNVGSTGTGGVTRLGYSKEEDEMHEIFASIGEELGCKCYHDEVGNTFVSNTDEAEYTLIGSHLDSVIDGGRYDGVSGIITGLLILHWLKENNINLPLKVVAFRCEESSNFGRCTIGSGLITKEIYKHDVGDCVSKAGERLKDIFDSRGYSLQPQIIRGAKQYFELHIEQGKVLEEYGDQVGIVSTIAGPRRFNLHILGQAEHSGATPMDMRSDALCGAAEIILEIENIGREESLYSSVATVGVVQNLPNALNVIPGDVTLGVDMRGIDSESLERMETRMKNTAKKICARRGLTFYKEKINEIPPIGMTKELQERLCKAAKQLHISHRVMPSGAGHDAMSFANICDTAMLFIPCEKGISHNKKEFTTIESICDGARVLFECLKEDAQ